MDQNSSTLLQRSPTEPDAFAAFYRRHFETILAFVVRRTYDVDSAVDLTAETFAQAMISAKRFRGSSQAEAEAWLFQIAKRQIGRYHRRGRVELKAIEKLKLEVPTLSPAAHADIENLADLESLRTTLRQELAALSEPQRAALHLRVVEEMTYTQVAAELQITEQAARLRVSRGLRTLASALGSNQMTKGLVR